MSWTRKVCEGCEVMRTMPTRSNVCGHCDDKTVARAGHRKYESRRPRFDHRREYVALPALASVMDELDVKPMDLAHQIDLSTSQIAAYRNGHASCERGAAELLARYLGATLEGLRGGGDVERRASWDREHASNESREKERA